MYLRMALALAFGLWLTSPVQAQVTCQQVGNQINCSDGLTYERYGNVTLDNQGNSVRQFGNEGVAPPNAPSHTVGPSAPALQQNQPLDNQGNTWNSMGNLTFGPNGRMCQRLGTTTFCN
jgi:hypothetical protein